MFDAIFDSYQWLIVELWISLPQLTPNSKNFKKQIVEIYIFLQRVTDEIHQFFNDRLTNVAIFFRDWIKKFAIFSTNDLRNSLFINDRLTKFAFFFSTTDWRNPRYCNWLKEFEIFCRKWLTKFKIFINDRLTNLGIFYAPDWQNLNFFS